MGAGYSTNPVLPIQREQIRNHLPRGGNGRRLPVLDIGCGAGTTTLELLAGRDDLLPIGADLSVRAVREYAEATGFGSVQLDAERLPFPDGSIGAVIADDILEHLVDTDAFAREVHRVLIPGGLLFLTTPNLAAWFNRLALLAGVQPAFTEVSFERVFGRPGDDLVGHLRLFTKRATLEFLDHHRFDALDVAGAPFPALPTRLAPLDRALSRVPSVAATTIVVARARRNPG
jgi:SAM-dependent methyltransferase